MPAFWVSFSREERDGRKEDDHVSIYMYIAYNAKKKRRERKDKRQPDRFRGIEVTEKGRWGSSGLKRLQAKRCIQLLMPKKVHMNSDEDTADIFSFFE